MYGYLFIITYRYNVGNSDLQQSKSDVVFRKSRYMWVLIKVFLCFLDAHLPLSVIKYLYEQATCRDVCRYQVPNYNRNIWGIS